MQNKIIASEITKPNLTVNDALNIEREGNYSVKFICKTKVLFI